MNEFKTEQENFWAGSFGDEYIGRNSDQQILASNLRLFSKILSLTKDVNDVIEFGPNIGNNLCAIKCLMPKCLLSGVEINQKAADILEAKGIEVYRKSIIGFEVERQRDLALIKGVLIHINPDELQGVYRALYKASARYIVVVEYYSPSPVMIPYRGHDNRLFKRDFAGELLDMFNDLTLVDYGFVYHRDNHFKQDDLTWFLLEKKG